MKLMSYNFLLQYLVKKKVTSAILKAFMQSSLLTALFPSCITYF